MAYSQDPLEIKVKLEALSDCEDVAEEEFSAEDLFARKKEATDVSIHTGDASVPINPVDTDDNIKTKSLKIIFKLFMSDDILIEVCRQTNLEIQRMPGCKVECISFSEMEAFVAVLLASSQTNTPLSDLWNEGPFCQPFYTAAMSLDRFYEIYSNITFDCSITRKARLEASGNKLEPLLSVFNKFVQGCRSNYSFGPKVKIDERIVSYDGKCPFLVRSKSAIKMISAADDLTNYIFYLKVCTEQENPEQGDKIKKNVSLVEDVLNMKLTLSSVLPRSSLNSSSSAIKADIKMVSYEDTNNREVLLLKSEEANSSSAEARSKLIMFYNDAKEDVKDFFSETSCFIETKKWPFRLFMELLDIAAQNTYITWSRQNASGTYISFLRDLSMDLAVDNVMLRQANVNQMKKSAQMAMKLVMCHLNKDNQKEDSGRKRIRLCHFCPLKSFKRTTLSCHSCDTAVCREHRKSINRMYCSYCDSV